MPFGTYSSLKAERHIFSWIQLRVQVRTVCDLLEHMSIHRDIQMCQLKTAFSATPHPELMSWLNQAADEHLGEWDRIFL